MSSAVFFLFFFAIVVHDLLSDSKHIRADVGERGHDDSDLLVVHGRMMPPLPSRGKWPFQPRLRQTQIESSPPRHGARSNQPYTASTANPSSSSRSRHSGTPSQARLSSAS